MKRLFILPLIMLVMMAVPVASHAQTTQEMLRIHSDDPATAKLMPSIGPLENTFELWNSDDTDDFETIRERVERAYEGKFKGRGSGYKQYKRWEYMARRHLDEDGQLINVVAKNWEEYGKYLKDVPWGKSTHGYWYSIGPSSWANTTGWNPGIGRVNVVAFHPTSTNTIFAGCPSGGLWRSTDNGANWTNMTDGMPLIGVSGFVVDPTFTNTWYLLTGDGDARETYSIGVLKTTNGGVNWQPTGLSWSVTDYRRGYKLRMHPTDRSILFVACSLGIYRTDDYGETWTQEQAGWFYDIEFKPGDPTIMYATTASSFYRSTDTGQSWTLINSGTPVGATRTEIGVRAGSSLSNYVYLMTGPATAVNFFKGVYRSTDSGLNFSLRSDTPNLLGYSSTGNDDRHQTTYDLAIAVDPNNSNTVYVGGINTWKSTDGGATWTITSWWDTRGNTIGYTHADIHDMVFDTRAGRSRLFVGSDGGCFYSDDAASNWTDVSTGLRITQFYRIGGTNADSTLIMGGTQDNGCNKFDDPSFTHVRGADGFECAIDPTNSNIIYTARQYGTVERSADGGATWPVNGINPDNGEWITPYHLRPSVNTTIFGGWGSIYRSTNSGANWTNLADPIPGDTFNMAHGISYDHRLYASNETYICRSDDINAAAPTWTNISAGLPLNAVRPLTYIAVDPHDAWDLCVTMGGYSAGNKVFSSTDRGATWTNISGSLPNVPVHCAVYDPNIDNHSLYVGTDIGVFYRNDSLSDWIPYRNGLPHVIVMEMEIRGTTLTAATYGRGLWRTDLFSTCPADYILSPANDPSNPNFSGNQLYEASNSVTSTRTITGGIGTDVTYQAGSYVDLLDGFYAREGSLFSALLGVCSAKGGWAPIRLMGEYKAFAVDPAAPTHPPLVVNPPENINGDELERRGK